MPVHRWISVAFATAVSASASLAHAQTPTPWSAHDALDLPAQVKLSGSVRTRYEAVDGQVRPGFEAGSDLFNVRSNLFAEYDFGAVRAGGELYDSRAYGAGRRTPMSTNEVNAVELVQAYVALDMSEPLGAETSGAVQAGRFLLNLGSRRLVAADDYRNTTNAYSGARVDVAALGGWKTILIYVMPQLRLPDDLDSVLDNAVRTDRESRDAILWGGVSSKTRLAAGAAGEASFFHFEERDAPGRPTRDRNLDTASVRLIREPRAGAFDYEIEAIRQWGSASRGFGSAEAVRDVLAGFLHLDAGYTFSRAGSPRVSAEFDYASGDDGVGDIGRFDTLFGMRRADLAPAGLYNAVGRANIATPGLRLEASPSPRLDLFVAGRLMWLASETDSFSTTGVRDVTGGSGGFAGRQVEGRLRYWIVPVALRFEIDALWLDKGRFLLEAANAPDTGDSRYVSLNLTASF